MRALVVVGLLGVAACGTGWLGVDAGDTDTDTALPIPGTVIPDPLASEDFAFCHEDGADADQARRWCAMLDDLPPDACPGLRQTCAEGAFEVTQGGCDDFGRGLEGAFSGDAEEVDRAWERSSNGCTAQTLKGGDALVTWLGAISVAVLLIGLARMLLRSVGWGRHAPLFPEPPQAAVAAVVDDGIEGDDDLPALPEAELLARARTALTEGRLGEAVVYARGAALRRLARHGRLVLHRARTDREYLRAVRDDPATRDALGQLLRAVEDHRFAGRVLSEAAARGAVDAAGRLVGVALAVLLLGLLTPAWASRRHAPDGDAALARLLDDAGYRRVRDGGWLVDVDGDVDVVVLDLTRVIPREEDWDALQTWVEDGGVLVVGATLTTSLGGFGAMFGSWTLASTHGDDLVTRGFLRDGDVPVPRWPSGPFMAWCGEDNVPLVVVPRRVARKDHLEVEGGQDDADDEEAATCPLPRVVAMAPWGEGFVVGIADADLFRNAALAVPDNRAFLVGLLPAGRDAGVFDLPEHPRVLLATVGGTGKPPSPLSVMANARLLPFILQLFAFWTLLALWRGWPLVPAHDPPDRARADFGEHARALGRHWQALEATRYAAAAHARWALSLLGPRGVAQALVRHGRSVAEADRTVAEVEALVADADGADDPEDLLLVEELWSTMTGPTST